MLGRFAHDQKMSTRIGSVFKPLIVLDMVAVVVVMSLVPVWEDSNSVWSWTWVIALIVLVGLILPAMLLSMRVRIHVDDRLYSVRLWPFPFKSNVPRRSIKAAYRREVRPMKEYGGWGVRARRRDVLYSLGGRRAVTVEFRRKGQTRKLTVATERADELLAALSA